MALGTVKRRAFTLVELLMVVMIMGILGAVTVGGYRAMQRGMEERGVMDKALGYYLLVGSLYDDASMVPHALSRASAILKEMGRKKESADVLAELRKRFPDAPEAK